MLPILQKLKQTIKNDKELYLRLINYLKPYKKWFLVMFLTSIPLAAVDGAIAAITGPVVDRFLKDENFSILKAIPLLIIAVTVVQGVLMYANTYCTVQLTNAISKDLRSDLFSKLAEFDLPYFKQNTTGDIYSRFYVDTLKLQQAIVVNLHDFILQFFTLVFLVGVLLYQNWKFAFIALFIISFMVIPLTLISKKLRRLDYKMRDLNSDIIVTFTEFLYGIKEVKVFQLVPYMTRLFNGKLVDLFNVSISSNKAGALLKPSMQFISSIGIGLILFLGAIQIEQDTMTVGAFTSFMVAMALMLKPVKTVGGILSKVSVILAPAERVFGLMDREPELIKPVNPKTIDGFESLKFNHVSLAYNENEKVLQDISLTITPGETVALVGPSGGGKSSLVNLIPRFIDPVEGEILMNGTNLKEIGTKSIFDQIAVVAQENILFNLSIRENIRMGRLNATEKEIEDAAKAANLWSWLTSIPDGLDTIVGERGELLSGGQRQRVAIARAFLKNAPLLILDEATSALDNESEKLVQDALYELMKSKTVIIIAHRLSTIQHADRILVLEKGRIVQDGNHQKLVNEEGIYKKFYLMQFHESQQLDLLADPVEGENTVIA